MKLSKPFIYLIIGVVTLMASLWIGAYALHVLTPESWQHFPAFATAFMVFVTGAVFIAVSLVGLMEQLSDNNGPY